jgi:hypothetical protein
MLVYCCSRVTIAACHNLAHPVLSAASEVQFAVVQHTMQRA